MKNKIYLLGFILTLSLLVTVFISRSREIVDEYVPESTKIEDKKLYSDPWCETNMCKG